NANNVALSAASQGIKIAAIFVPTGSPFPIPIMQNYASVTGGLYYQTQPDGTGTADAIRAIIAYCGNGPTATPTRTPTRTPTPTPGQMLIGHLTWQGHTNGSGQSLPLTLTLRSVATGVGYEVRDFDSSGDGRFAVS